MANNSEFYRGKRKKASAALIAAIVVLAVIALLAMLFYGLQKYIVVTGSGVHLEIPFLEDGGSVQTAEGDTAVQSFEPVTAELEVGEADYTNIAATAGAGLSAVKLVYVPASSVTESGVDAYLGDDFEADGVLLDVKTVTGMLVWKSGSDIAQGYGTNGTVDLAPIVSSLKERGLYVAVRMCCFVDNTLASRYTQLALKTTAGQAFSDGNGAWIDPTSGAVRSYIAALCSELSEMGVDEIVLTGFRLPDAQGYEYAFSSSSAVAPTAETAIAGAALSVTRSMRSGSAKLSVQITSSSALTEGLDSVTGQNAEVFFKIFDRVYYSVDADSAADAVAAAEDYVTLGDVNARLVPICSEAPETQSYVISQ